MPIYKWNSSLNILDRSIAFHRCFVDIAGDVAGAVFLSQLVYWSKKVEEEKDFWFYKSVEEWKEETGLSRDQQLRVRTILKKKGILEEREAKIEHRIYFRLNLESLIDLVRGGGAIPPNRETRHARVVKPDAAESENPTPPSRETRFRSISSEITAETTTETTPTTEVKSPTKTLKPEFNYKAFQSRYYKLVGATPKKYDSSVKMYEDLCRDYGEERVLDCLSEWVDAEGGRKKLFREQYGPKNFLENAEIMLATAPYSPISTLWPAAHS